MHYYRTGKGQKPPILLVHGVTDNGLCWLRVAKHLEKTRDVIMIDVRGHGKTIVDEEGLDLVSAARDVAVLIDFLQLDTGSLVLAGHSMGGQIVSLVAALYPGKMHSIILEESSILDIGTRIESSLVGRNSEVRTTTGPPKTIRFMVGDYSQIEIC